MKPQQDRHANRHCAALTRVDVLVVVGVVMVLVMVVGWREFQLHQLQTRIASKAWRIQCANNLKLIGLAAQLWAKDHDDQFPTSALITNANIQEWIAAGNAVPFFQVMSNELAYPKIMICPTDNDHAAATSFTNGFSPTNISYFIGLNADDRKPQTLLSGDDNFEIGGVPVKSGLLEIPTNAPLAWTAARHKFAGNIGLADGSVQQVTSSALRGAMAATGTATNRLLIP